MKALGKAWKKLKPGSAQRAPYEEMARARKRSIDLEGDADGDAASIPKSRAGMGDPIATG